MKKFLLTPIVCSLFYFGCGSAIAQNASNLELAKGHIYAKYPSLNSESKVGWIVTDEVKSKHNNVSHLYLRQTLDGIEIINVNLSAAILNGKVIHLAGKVLEKIERPAQGMNASLSREQAVHASATHLGISAGGTLARMDQSTIKGATVFNNTALSVEPIPVKLVLWLGPKGELKLAYDLSIYPPDQQNWWSMRVDAQSGEILEQGNWVVKCSFDEPHVHSDMNKSRSHNDSPSLTLNGGEQYNVFAMPLESPNHGARSIVSSPFNPAASPFGWHDTNGVSGAEFTITRGNNVHAYEDEDANNLPGFSPDGGASLNFDFSYLSNGNPDNYRSASITNLFYWNNIIHDVLYEYGFDESSGNFQQTNYTGLGLGGDYVMAEDLDGSGTNNANFGTPADGSRPRMQMFLWSSGGSVDLVITSPLGIAGTYSANIAQFGPSLIDNPVSGQFAFVNDGTAFPTRGCSPLTNGSDLNGKIAVIDRGDCNFTVKVKNAQNAGAIGVLMLSNDNAGGAMGGTDPTITIPSLMVNLDVANTIRGQLAGAQGSLQNNTFFVSGGFDNGIITHEYGHGVSNRLTGGPSNADCLTNSEQMGEGWSDYLGLMLTVKEGDTGSDVRGIGTYAIGEPVSGNGIRPAPYSTNMAINPYTYAGVANENSISQPHGIGFIWCTMLWDMTWKFVERYGLDPDIQNGSGGNNMALQLVMDGMKLQPCGPGFVDGRDAILLADQINNNGANQDIIWEAFAGRGLGFSASQGSPNNRFDGIEAFDMPSAIQIESLVDKTLATFGDELTFDINVKNILNSTETNVVVQTSVPSGVSFLNDSQTEGATFTDGKVEFTVSNFDPQESYSFSFKGTIDNVTAGTQTAFFDNHEAGGSRWVVESLSGSNPWVRNTQSPFDGTFAWFVPNEPSVQDQTLRFANSVSISIDSKLAIWHSYDTEADFDGGVIEISTDNGASWSDAGGMIIENGYNGNIVSESYNRNAFSGRSDGYIKTIINLSSLGENNIRVRFRLLSDASVGGIGWRIDNVYIFKGEEVLLTSETCVTFDGQIEPNCKETKSTVFPIGYDCLPYAGFLRAITPLQFCPSDLSALNFGVIYGVGGINNPGTGYSYRFILSERDEPYAIHSVSPNGQFNVVDLPIGEYRMWGLSYSNTNEQTSVDSYLDGIIDVSTILDQIGSEAICADLVNRLSNGNVVEISKIECVIAGIPLDETSFISYYPNPSKGELTLQVANHSGSIATMKVFDISGKLVFNEKYQIQGVDYQTTVKLNNAKAGLYIINIELDHTLYSGRIVIE
jgi:uncharacterized repeat protein (TIGR01451 family)